MAVTSPGKSMVAAASKGRGIGRGNFYKHNAAWAVTGRHDNKGSADIGLYPYARIYPTRLVPTGTDRVGSGRCLTGTGKSVLPVKESESMQLYAISTYYP